MTPMPKRKTGKRGRPSKFTPELGLSICRLVMTGVPIGEACRVQGIGRNTLHVWRTAGAAGRAPFAAFLEEIERAQAQAVASITMHVVKAAQKDWRAGAWWLERRCPELYGTKQTVRLEKAPADMSDAELDAAILAHGFVRAPLVEGDV